MPIIPNILTCYLLVIIRVAILFSRDSQVALIAILFSTLKEKVKRLKEEEKGKREKKYREFCCCY